MDQSRPFQILKDLTADTGSGRPVGLSSFPPAFAAFAGLQNHSKMPTSFLCNRKFKINPSVPKCQSAKVSKWRSAKVPKCQSAKVPKCQSAEECKWFIFRLRFLNACKKLRVRAAILKNVPRQKCYNQSWAIAVFFGFYKIVSTYFFKSYCLQPISAPFLFKKPPPVN